MVDFDGIRVYAAGKITKNGWRHGLFPVTDDFEYENPDTTPWPAEAPIGRSLPGATYVGPHFISDDHGCYHGENSHGVAAGDIACAAYPGLSRPEVAARCLGAISSSTHVFAWVDDPTCHGTLVEIGYARALGKQVHLYTQAGRKELDDLWFAGQIATAHGSAATAREAWADFCLRLR